jgi:hypothetical protein
MVKIKQTFFHYLYAFPLRSPLRKTDVPVPLTFGDLRSRVHSPMLPYAITFAENDTAEYHLSYRKQSPKFLIASPKTPETQYWRGFRGFLNCFKGFQGFTSKKPSMQCLSEKD